MYDINGNEIAAWFGADDSKYKAEVFHVDPKYPDEPWICAKVYTHYDTEWEEAERVDEPTRYYWQEMSGGGRCVKMYKPSVAELVSKRTRLKTTLIN